MYLRPVLLVFIISLYLSACKNKGAYARTWKKPETQTISCVDYFSEITPNGILYNNVWNKNAAKSFSWSQCLEKNPSTGLPGWSWTWPNTSNVIYSYPQIKLGISPWAPQPKLSSDFPLDNTSIRSLVIEHELEIQGNSEHNVATSLWLTNTKNIGENPNPGAIIAELMIWSYSTPNHMNPAGVYKGNFEAGDQTWEVWATKNWTDASGANTNTWVYITFRAKNKSLSAAFDVKKFTNFAIEQDILPKNFYISDVELGTEIMGGSGLVWVKKFSATVN
ncbi:MAG: hypothetical protein U1F46_17545 [Marinagarivorans sp.]